MIDRKQSSGQIGIWIAGSAVTVLLILWLGSAEILQGLQGSRQGRFAIGLTLTVFTLAIAAMLRVAIDRERRRCC